MEVSTELRLYDDPWRITKGLTKSDVNGSSRLLLGRELVETHILPLLGPVLTANIDTNVGARVTIQDLDTQSEHQLTLKKWHSTKSYVLINNWKREFVVRRNLSEGDEIGLLWNPLHLKFYFRLLKRRFVN